MIVRIYCEQGLALEVKTNMTMEEIRYQFDDMTTDWVALADGESSLSMTKRKLVMNYTIIQESLIASPPKLM